MRVFRIFTVLMLLILLLTSLPGATFGKDKPIKIRIGWQVPWATQGQLVQILKHTDILKNNGLSADFIGRTYGPVLNEIALAGDIDVVLTADQPAVALFSKNQGWIGIARLMYNRTSTYVPIESPIQSIGDLKNKKIGIPIGAAAERVTLQALIRAGIDSRKDVRIVNLGIREQAPLIQKWRGSPTWGDIDALSGFDPSPAIFEANGMVRVLDVGKVCSLVLMNQDFLARHPDVGKRLVASLIDAYDYYRQNVKEANEWFINEARLKDCNQKACNIAASIEPNVWCSKREEIRVHFTEDDFKIIEGAADFLSPRLGRVIKVRKFVTNEYVSKLK
jgi:ABC-type nitrate/sulfonate/bicarbonate transport system substrate-binding protein